MFRYNHRTAVFNQYFNFNHPRCRNLSHIKSTKNQGTQPPGCAWCAFVRHKWAGFHGTAGSPRSIRGRVMLAVIDETFLFRLFSAMILCHNYLHNIACRPSSNPQL
jgi:hypothetical protein